MSSPVPELIMSIVDLDIMGVLVYGDTSNADGPGMGAKVINNQKAIVKVRL